MSIFYCPDTKAEWSTAVCLIDMMAFFPSVEQLDDPAIRGRPVAVTNGSAGSTIISCSYEAREFGIRTGTKMKTALLMCPELVHCPSRPERYAKISGKIMAALNDEITPDQEIFSIDESFLDLKGVLNYFGSVQAIADKIRKTVYEASGGLRCSIGISSGKLTAKYCAKLNKGGTSIITPDKIKDHIASCPIGDICGIGKKTEFYLKKCGVNVCGDLRKLPMSTLSNKYGDNGRRLYLVCTEGVDPYPVVTEQPDSKSMGHSKVLPPATTDKNLVRGIMRRLTERLASRLRRNELLSNHFKIEFKTDMGWVSQKYPLMPATQETAVIWELVTKHFTQWHGDPLYQVGVTAISLSSTQEPQQLNLFADTDKTQESNKKIDSLKDQINKKFGKYSVQSAAELLSSDANMVPVISFNYQPKGSKNSL
ncbi:MAG: DNA polymerase IV [Gammaproteobacteria bacterium]|nr:MAG: DNA polymerase IV [Gammaproteobacteria bacterium]